MDDLLAEFIGESREMLEAIGGELVAWEADPTDSARLDAIFRFVHTVKGNCGFFDFPRLEALSHAAEGVLAEVRAGRRVADRDLVDAVLAVIDRISDMIDAIEAGQPLPEGGDESLIAGLEKRAAEADAAEPAEAIEPAAPASRAPASGAVRSIRLPVEVLDRVMGGVSDLVLARNDLSRRVREADLPADVTAAFERLSAILDQVRDGITGVRMQRIEHVFATLPRLVRDISAELGKQVLVDIEGGFVELDREMIEMIRDPLIHIVRNAIDHGLETPAERRAAGKRETGLLHVHARQVGNRIVLSVGDDGRGIDVDKVGEKAIAAGLVTPQQLAAMSHAERQDLIFEPGLSTAGQVTAISGRGVGMDVVRANIMRIGGSLQVESGDGEGTTITLRLPLTLSIIPSIGVSVGDQRFAVPRAYIEEIVDARADSVELNAVGSGTYVHWRGQRLACLHVGPVLGIENCAPPENSLLIVATLASGQVIVLAVDRIDGNDDIVVKPLAPTIAACGYYSGCTLLDDGSPMLMLDLAGLATAAGIFEERKGFVPRIVEMQPAARVEQAADPVLVFIDLAGQRRAVRMESLRRIETAPRTACSLAGSQPQIAIDGVICPLMGTEPGLPDGADVRYLRIGDGTRTVAFAIDRVVDTARIDTVSATGVRAPDECVTAMVDGQMVALLDSEALLARCPDTVAPLSATGAQ